LIVRSECAKESRSGPPINEILNSRWLKCKDGKELLALQASGKEPLQGLLYVLEEGYKRQKKMA
jgi:hypothetical protein